MFLESGANALDVSEAVHARMAELKHDRFPADLDYLIPYDTTRFVSASIASVIQTISEAALIVLLAQAPSAFLLQRIKKLESQISDS